jgi:hypothetical protein
MIHNKLIRIMWRVFWDILQLIRDRLAGPERLCRYLELFRMTIMHTKLIRIKYRMFWNMLQVAGVN